MFGYLRPEKDDLLVKEFAIYRAVYCGICKQIKKDYGNIPRAALSYDITFLGILLISLSENDASVVYESCVLNPFRKKPVSKDHPAIVFCAAISVIFAYYKLLDEIRDDKRILASAGRILIKKAYDHASLSFPEENRIIREGISALNEIEKSGPDKETYMIAAQAFGTILNKIMERISEDMLPDDIRFRQEIISALGLLGSYIGNWIYITDAIDDLESDIKRKQWNPFIIYNKEEALDIAGKTLRELEDKCDETAALLPYKRFAGIASNVFREGMPKMSTRILAGIKPDKL